MRAYTIFDCTTLDTSRDEPAFPNAPVPDRLRGRVVIYSTFAPASHAADRLARLARGWNPRARAIVVPSGNGWRVVPAA